MKFDVLLFFSFMFVQVYASFYGQFRGAMSNVERGFTKLLSDVVIDVKDTLHCTISAVEQVLAMNGLLEESSNFNNKCRGYAKPINIPKARDRYDNFFERHLQYNQPRRHLSTESELEHISQELESSIANVNKSINDILGRREVKSNFKVVTELLKDETDRLNAVSKLLGRELENISMNVRNKIGKLHMGHKKPGETIWEDLKVLHDLKAKSHNKTEINEISNIINRVVSELHVVPSKKELTEDEKLEAIKKQLDKYESGKENKTAVINTKEIVQTQISTEKDIKSFKDLAQNIMKNDNILPTDSNIGQVFKREAISREAITEKSLFGADMPTFKREAISHEAITEKSLFGADMATLDSSSPFYNPNPTDDSKKMVDDAKNLMAESKKSEDLLNNFFNDHQQSNTDVFSNADMFNFG